MGVPELLGASIGTMVGNPTILIAGLIVSRNSPRNARFWLELIGGAVVCTIIQLGFEKGVDDLPSNFSFDHWLVLVSLGTMWATGLFLLVRSLRSLAKRPSTSA